MKDFSQAADSGNLPSPCVNICRMDPNSGLCEGCLRTLDEITQWSSASESRKQAIWLELRQRAEQLKPAPPAEADDPGAQGQR